VAHKYVNNYEFSKEGNVFRTGVTSIVLWKALH
jgi:hypothetical protein